MTGIAEAKKIYVEGAKILKSNKISSSRLVIKLTNIRSLNHKDISFAN
jgi:hypothetical protein